MSLRTRIQERNARFAAKCSDRTLQFYVIKCLLGTFICYALYRFFPGHQLYWAIVSVLLVLSPAHQDSVHFSMARIWANAIGAAVGLACFLLPIPMLPALSLGVVVTIVICNYLPISAAVRSALAALVIVFIQQRESSDWTIALERVISVLIGCLVALALTLGFRALEQRLQSRS